ncbi:CPBP family intramembrane metalloprotease [Myxacorys almedinensis A]|uniref:CPBP family intramembrane metalloprotease n=1 Tax=Myxacorys almedinensis A TaxID=2690445 RepID=A0A8J7YWY4_9CYAN|nr:CPBP family intramembrane metalloprotease [Myxacorys almedinensis A]
MLPFFNSVGFFITEAPTWLEIGFFFLIWSLLWLPIAVPLAIALRWRPPKPPEISQKLPLLASLYLLAPVVLWGVARLQNLPFATFGWHWDRSVLTSLGVGVGIGAIGLILLFGLQTLFGLIRWAAQDWRSLAGAIASGLLIGLAIAGIEELVFRGFVFGQLLQDVDFWTSAIASSILFALLHLIWEGVENIPQLPGLSLMGVVLCLAVSFKAGQPDLGLAWGLHAGWIWAMTSLDAAKFSYTGRAPDWLTGLDGKPLAGFAALGFLLATAGIVLAMLPS